MRYTTQFLLSALAAAQFPPPDAPEIAFLGRSNVGKSSLLNKLVGEKAAKVSQTPGRTRAINFFALLDSSRRPKLARDWIGCRRKKSSGRGTICAGR